MDLLLTIFIVEHDLWYGQLLHYHLSLNPDDTVHPWTSGQECLDNIHLQPDVVTIDFSLPDTSGDKLLGKLRQRWPEVPVIIISAQNKIATAGQLLKAGATDYLVKDDNTKGLLWNAVQRLRETADLREQVKRLGDKLQAYDYPGNVRELKTIIELAAVLSNGHEIEAADIVFAPAARRGKYDGRRKNPARVHPRHRATLPQQVPGQRADDSAEARRR